MKIASNFDTESQEPNSISESKIGLALSGGGVRAAAFHLGVLAKLHELGILQQVDVISSVSGGSIITAKYTLDGLNSFPSFADEMKACLSKSLELRTLGHWTFWAAVVLPFYTRTDALAATYDRLYYHKRTLSNLPINPQVIINATNVNTGKNWKFKREGMGDWVTGMTNHVGSFPVSRAVAASSAAPPLLYPLRLRAKKYYDNPKYPVRIISLSDGGLYDNQGTHSLLSSGQAAAKCTHLICSDASFPFDKQKTRVWSFLPIAALRNISILMSQIRNLQFRNLVYGQYAETVKSAFFAMDWTVPDILLSLKQNTPKQADPRLVDALKNVTSDELNQLNGDESGAMAQRERLARELEIPELLSILTKKDIEKISQIGTRLRALKKTEIDNLYRHGESLCGMQVRAYCRDLLHSNKS